MSVSGAFEITAWDADPPYDAPADGPPLARITVRKRFSGALEGESVAELLVCAEAGYVASERVRGRLDGREGTFVLQHGATDGAGGAPFQFGNVVPGSGTGALAGLRGSVVMEHERYTLEYELPG
jgi:Protein of unknown function (DUF3224)